MIEAGGHGGGSARPSAKEAYKLELYIDSRLAGNTCKTAPPPSMSAYTDLGWRYAIAVVAIDFQLVHLTLCCSSSLHALPTPKLRLDLLLSIIAPLSTPQRVLFNGSNYPLFQAS